MNTKTVSLVLTFLFAVTAAVVAAPSIKQTIASINADAAKPGGPAKVVQSISKSTGVPAATLESQKASTGFSYGDIYAAYSIARASGKNFAEIAALKKKGQTWDQIAEANGVSLGGQKKVAKTEGPAPAASPSPEPVKTQAQLQRERWSQQTQITNVPKPKATPKP